MTSDRHPAATTPASTAPGGSPVFLALQAGGVAGIGHMGVARVLHVLDQHYPIHTIVGTSAGSDAGAVIASGLGDEDAKQAVLTFPYADLERPNWLQRLPVIGSVVGSAANLVLQQGIFDGERIRTDMDAVLAKAGVRVFADYDRKVAAGVTHSAHFAAVAWDVNKGIGLDNWQRLLMPQNWINGTAQDLIRSAFTRQAGVVVFPAAYSKDYGVTDPSKQSVGEAVRASSSIPFVFTPAHLAGHVLVDGGVGAMLPHQQALDLAQASGLPAWRVVNVALGGVGAAPSAVHGQLSPVARHLLAALRAGAEEARDALLESPAGTKDTVVVDTAGISGTQFSLTREQQMLLYDSGVVSAVRFALDDRRIQLTATDVAGLTDLMQTTKTELDGLVRLARSGQKGLDAGATLRIDAAAASVLGRLADLSAPDAGSMGVA